VLVSGRITTHYSAPEIGNLVAAVNRIADSLRAAPGTENLGQRVTEVLRPYRKELVEREGLEPSIPAL
jgi:hypothetical protein